MPSEVTIDPGRGNSAWQDVLIDASNKVWLAGYDSAQLGPSIEPSGNARAVLARLGTGGTLEWDSGDLFETGGLDVMEALTTDGNGTVYAVGRTAGSFAGHANAGKTDLFVAWSDVRTAHRSWAIGQYGNERPQRPRRASFLAGNGLVVAGYDDEYVPTNYVEAWADPFAVALTTTVRGDGVGVLGASWQHQFNTQPHDFVDGLGLTPDGRASLVTGQLGNGMFVRKLDAQGKALWTARYGTLAVDNIATVLPLADGTAWIAGSISGSFRGAPSAGGQDVFVARIDLTDGHVMSSWQLGSSGADWLTDMRQDKTGNLILFGETTGSFVTGAPNAGGTDLFMLKVSPTGTRLAARQWGGTGDEAATRVALDSCGNAVAVGSTMRDGARRAMHWYWKPEA